VPVPDSCEDLAYTKQYFTITRTGHTHPTAQFGAPTLVWHVAFWPRSEKDPHDFDVTTSLDGNACLKEADRLRAEHGARRADVVAEFNNFLNSLQERGRVAATDSDAAIFKSQRPLDWTERFTGDEPFPDVNVEASGFTLWWADAPPLTGNMVPSGTRPRPTDIRVRVQAEVHADFCSLTFLIDAGKPWNGEPVYTLSDVNIKQLGSRRRAIFQHVENIKTICEGRVDARDAAGTRLVDRALLPEPNPLFDLSGKTLEFGFTDSAKALKVSADYLYQQLWDEFCKDYGFNLCDVAGETDEIFANFRGLVLSTRGVDKPSAAPSLTASRATEPFSRFEGTGMGYGSNATEPVSVVKAFMPFMRRMRSEADWRDWIACGIFDWRAIYITSLGAQSEFRSLDECEFNTSTDSPGDIPAGYLPERLTRNGVDPRTLPECARYAMGREAPVTPQDDRPAPFRYLLLTKFEPNRGQVGRMVERINTTGTRRLYALKNWTIINQASNWVRIYGLQLDAAYQQWIKAIEDVESAYADKLETYNDVIWSGVKAIVNRLRSANAQVEANAILGRYRRDPARASEELSELPKQFGSEDAKVWSDLREYTAKVENNDFRQIRTVQGNRDTDIAAANHNVERVLIGISAGLDQLGAAAIGGLQYRISRSRHYADLFRDGVRNLRVGNIETWWSYEQFAVRGMEPALRHITEVGERMDKLRARLQAVKQDILQSSIATQTEATRDNTHRLERIQAELKVIAVATRASTDAINKLQRRAAYFGAASSIFTGLYGALMAIYAAIVLYLLLRNIM
jgi:hypothetical protein